jgi:uncharacterized protein GlcG (DUF336 family)
MVTLAQANGIIDSAFASATSDGVPPLTVVVIDAAGDIVSAQRQDGASMFRIDVAFGKAWGAVAMGVSSRTLAERAKGNPNFFAGLAAASKGRLLAQPGAVLIRDANGAIIGAVGASGGSGDEDEACCQAGIRHAGLVSEQ